MTRSEWKNEYVSRLVDRWLDHGLALSVYDAGRGDHNYGEDPTDAADEELSYWGD